MLFRSEVGARCEAAEVVEVDRRRAPEGKSSPLTQDRRELAAIGILFVCMKVIGRRTTTRWEWSRTTRSSMVLEAVLARP